MMKLAIDYGSLSNDWCLDFGYVPEIDFEYGFYDMFEVEIRGYDCGVNADCWIDFCSWWLKLVVWCWTV